MTPSRRTLLRGFLALPVAARFAPVVAPVVRFPSSTGVMPTVTMYVVYSAGGWSRTVVEPPQVGVGPWYAIGRC